MASQDVFSGWLRRRLPAYNYPGAATRAASVATTGQVLGANVAVFAPVLVNEPVRVTRIMFNIQVQDGNYDVGIYTRNGARIVNLTSTACPATGFQFGNITDTPLQRGVYYIGFSTDSASLSIGCPNAPALAAACSLLGARQMAAAFPLPVTATFAAYALTRMPGLEMEIS